MHTHCQETSGMFYCLTKDGNFTKQFEENVGISNGLCWSPDNKYMYYIDTDRQAISRFDFDS